MARSSPTPLPRTPRPRIRLVPLGWFWPLFWGGLMVGSGAVGLWALAWLTQIPPLPDCTEISRFSSDSDRLICAETQMQSASPQDLIQAIALIADWRESHPLYEDALPILTEASQRLLQRATASMHGGELDRAVELANAIPLETPLRADAQAAIWNWRQEWEKAGAIETTVTEAIAAQDWTQAQDSLQQLKSLDSDYWLATRFGELEQTIDQERAAWDQLKQARALADSGDPEELGEALTLAQQVRLTSAAWGEAKRDIDRWSHNLLLYSFQRWELGDIEGAVAAVQKVPPDPTLAPEAQDLILFSHAQRLAAQATTQHPTYLQLFYLMEAIRAAETIASGSPFYSAAQDSQADWHAQLMDLRTLKLADAIAGFGQPWAFRYASDLAITVQPERPRRIQAQTLIAHWQSEIERSQDRPYLIRANRLAQAGTIAALRAAITEAKSIDLGRALRLEAQTRIATWLSQIEVIEDQPILTEANTLAAAGKLKEAIEAVGEIQPDRALYDQAQAMAQDWTRTLQIREDGPILAQAKELAYQGSLTAAINLASQIGSGRALYSEARNAIALWQAERDYIWSLEESSTAAPGEGLEDIPEDEGFQDSAADNFP